MEDLPRLLLGAACAMYFAYACGAPFSGPNAENGGAAGSPAAMAGTSGRGGSGNAGKPGSAGQDSSGGSSGESAGGDGTSGGSGAPVAEGGGGNVGSEPCVVDPDADGSCAGAIAAGSYSTCAIREAGSVRCWGYNVNGRLGDGLNEHETCSGGSEDCSSLPVSVAGVADARFVMGGENSFCMLNAARTLWCWGFDTRNATDIGSGVVEQFTEFSVQMASVRVPIGALDDQGVIWMAGTDHLGSGVFGVGETTPGERRDFASIPELEGALALDVSWYHSCAVLGSNAVACWGRGLSGEIGDGELANRFTPTVVTALENQPAIAVAAGDGASCALLDGGSVWCWGSNDRGQLGSGTEADSADPVPVEGLTDAVEIDAGFGHACARRATGQVTCWGNDRHGQLGDVADHGNCSLAVPEPCSRKPVAVSELEDAVAISVGSQHSCALRASGDVVCWGFNAYGQLGDGSFDDAHTPVSVTEL